MFIERGHKNMKTKHTFSNKGVLSVLLLLLVFPVSTLAHDQDARPPKARAASFLQALWRSSGVPGVSVAVSHKGRIVFSKSLGYVDLDNLVPATTTSVYNIGSVSKVITAVAIMQLVEKDKISLDDPIRKYVPEFPDKGMPITIRQIMTHTSGIRHYRADERITPHGPYETFKEAISIFKDDPLLFEPGACYHYSSFAVNLLQGVIEKVSGIPFEEYMTRSVWGPAAMLRTSFDIPSRIVIGRAKGYKRVGECYVNHEYEDLTYKFASGGMISSVEDLIRFGEALNHGQLLGRESVSQMFEPQFDTLLRFSEDGAYSPITRWQQALLWRIRKDDEGRSFAYHCGTVKGFNACLVDYVKEDMVAAIANNAEAIGFIPLLEIVDFFR